MTHLELENLASDYLEGRLDAPRRRAVEGHLAACPACRETVDDVRRTLELMRAVEPQEPSPYLVHRILAATTGARSGFNWRRRLPEFFRPVLVPRLALGFAMAVFSFSVIVNAAGLSLRQTSLRDLNPLTWVYHANHVAHRLYARGEKFYYGLRMVYETQLLIKELRERPAEETPPATPPSEKKPGSFAIPTPSGTASHPG